MRGLILIAALALSGCELTPSPYPKMEPDQALRRTIFQECLKSVPAGPVSTVMNDWAEVVNECGSQAYYQSLTCVANCQATKPQVK